VPVQNIPNWIPAAVTLQPPMNPAFTIVLPRIKRVSAKEICAPCHGLTGRVARSDDHHYTGGEYGPIVKPIVPYHDRTISSSHPTDSHLLISSYTANNVHHSPWHHTPHTVGTTLLCERWMGVTVTILRYLHFLSSSVIPIIRYLSMTRSTLRYTLYFGLCRTPFP
jgi:hypothetical protein